MLKISFIKKIKIRIKTKIKTVPIASITILLFFTLFIFCYCQQDLFILKVSSLLSPLNEAELTSYLYIHITLATDTEVEWPCLTQLLKLLVSKKLFKELLFETEWSGVMLVWLFVSIKSTRTFLNIYFFNIFTQTILLVILTSLERLSLFHLQVSLW